MSAQPRRALTGVPAHAWAACACSEGADRSVIVLLASNLGAAETFAEETAQLLTLLNGAQPVARTLTEADAAVPAFEADCDLLGVLSLLRHGNHDAKRPLLIACTPGSLTRRSPAPEATAKAEIVIRKGEKLALQHFAKRLAEDFGYAHEALCEQPGEYALRGGILDVYPLNAQMPVRIDLFGDTVESLRPFDPATQRSEGEVDGLVICAPRDDSGSAPEAPFFRHLPPDALIVSVDRCHEDVLCAELHSTQADELVLEETDDAPLGYAAFALESTPAESLLIGSATDSAETRPALLRAAASLAKDGRPCLLAGDTDGSVDRLNADVLGAKIRSFAPRVIHGRFGGGVIITPGKLPGLLKEGLLLLTERELFGRRKRPLASSPAAAPPSGPPSVAPSTSAKSPMATPWCMRRKASASSAASRPTSTMGGLKTSSASSSRENQCCTSRSGNRIFSRVISVSAECSRNSPNSEAAAGRNPGRPRKRPPWTWPPNYWPCRPNVLPSPASPTPRMRRTPGWENSKGLSPTARPRIRHVPSLK